MTYSDEYLKITYFDRRELVIESETLGIPINQNNADLKDAIRREKGKAHALVYLYTKSNLGENIEAQIFNVDIRFKKTLPCASKACYNFSTIRKFF
ncbi:MAG: hypothetical protein H0U49_10655 [Parachlamydiaceae bacterium]|nr:hypothetical protein [Parachlamydiaceae bacterium]